jgi:hypothetical protein
MLLPPKKMTMVFTCVVNRTEGADDATMTRRATAILRLPMQPIAMSQRMTMTMINSSVHHHLVYVFACNHYTCRDWLLFLTVAQYVLQRSADIIMYDDDDDDEDELYMPQVRVVRDPESRPRVRKSKAERQQQSQAKAAKRKSNKKTRATKREARILRYPEWMSWSKHQPNSYYPQLGDRIVYVKQAHQIYLQHYPDPGSSLIPMTFPYAYGIVNGMSHTDATAATIAAVEQHY